MKITVRLNTKPILQFESEVLGPDYFAECLKQSAWKIYKEWEKESPQTDHQIEVTIK